MVQSSEIGREDTVELIPLDLPRTFPALTFFSQDGPYHPLLRQVLEAYVCYRPDVGYVSFAFFETYDSGSRNVLHCGHDATQPRCL